jgi:hypothetical protein
VAGRQIHPDPSLGIDFIRSRLTQCVDTHTKFCASPIGRSPSAPRGLPPRVYDIRNKRLVPGDKLPKGATYIALSYLWGSGVVSKPIRTVEANWKFRLESFDLPAQQDCPTTYRTAIDVATRLGVHYIWIDSICMIQDSDEDRKRHFSSFEEGVGQIYEDACLTLCSVGSDASNDLLASRTELSERVTIPFGGKPLVITPRVKWLYGHLASGGGNSAGWDTRGWTYQEWLLSPRLAYLTPSQAFFECYTVFEECGAEALSAGGHDARHALRTDDDREQLLELWHRIVMDYSGRNLGYWSDRLNGIRSVGMQLIRRVARLKDVTNLAEIKYDLVSGILRERLHHNLLWQSTSKGLKKITQAEWDKGKEHAPPSWSWASWSGPITWEMHLRATPIPQKQEDPVPTSSLQVNSINDDQIALRNAELVQVRAGKSLAITEAYDLHTYALEIGSRTCSQGYKMEHWKRMVTLLHPTSGEIIGRGAFDAETPADDVQCLIASTNPAKQNPHTFEETESVNALIIKAAPGGYVRIGVGEIFVRTGDRRVEPEKHIVGELTLV